MTENEKKNSPLNTIRAIIDGELEAEREKKASMQGRIDRADTIFQLLLLVFGLGFWVVMIIKAFL